MFHVAVCTQFPQLRRPRTHLQEGYDNTLRYVLTRRREYGTYLEEMSVVKGDLVVGEDKLGKLDKELSGW